MKREVAGLHPSRLHFGRLGGLFSLPPSCHTERGRRGKMNSILKNFLVRSKSSLSIKKKMNLLTAKINHDFLKRLGYYNEDIFNPDIYIFHRYQNENYLSKLRNGLWVVFSLLLSSLSWFLFCILEGINDQDYDYYN